MKQTGLFFGSFNPIHIGHLILANFMATQTDLDEVWLVVSPQNPLKPKSSLANDYDRLHLARIAVEDNPLLRVSQIEFNLPKPSFTIDTLIYLREKYPDREFALIMGGDNLNTLPKWKNYEILLRDYSIRVYRRTGSETGELAVHPNVKIYEAPLIDLSATYIRNCIKEGKSIRYLVPEPVFEYLSNNRLYR